MNGVHKETFTQQATEETPFHFVVFYWPEESDPATDTHKAAYFNDALEAEEFEDSLEDYDDWAGSQEEGLAVQ